MRRPCNADSNGDSDGHIYIYNCAFDGGEAFTNQETKASFAFRRGIRSLGGRSLCAGLLELDFFWEKMLQ